MTLQRHPRIRSKKESQGSEFNLDVFSQASASDLCKESIRRRWTLAQRLATRNLFSQIDTDCARCNTNCLAQNRRTPLTQHLPSLLSCSSRQPVRVKASLRFRRTTTATSTHVAKANCREISTATAYCSRLSVNATCALSAVP